MPVTPQTWNARPGKGGGGAVAAEQKQARLRMAAETNEKQAETSAVKSQQTAQFLKEMLRGVGPSVALGRDTAMLNEIVDQTAVRIGADLKDQPEVQIGTRSRK